MSPIQRIYEVNERMNDHKIDMREPLTINSSELNEVAEYIFTSLRRGPNYNLEYLKQSIKQGKTKLFGRTIYVLP